MQQVHTASRQISRTPTSTSRAISHLFCPPLALLNVSVVGTNQFLPVEDSRLYRGVNRTVEVELVDNSLQPLREVPVTYSWNADGTNGLTSTDKNGYSGSISQSDRITRWVLVTLTYEYTGDALHQSSTGQTELWVVSRTFIDLQSSVSGAFEQKRSRLVLRPR